MSDTTKRTIKLDVEQNVSKEMGDAKVKTESFTDSLNKAKLAWDSVAKGAEFAGEMVDKYAEREAAIGRLERSLLRAGANQADLSRQVENSRKIALTYGVAVNTQVDALQKLVEASDDALTAEKDLQLAMDISAADNRELSSVVEMLRKVRKGEVEELKTLNGINKEQAQELAKVEDSTRRAELALLLLNNAYAGAQIETAGTAEKTAAMRQQLEEAKVAFGALIIESMGAGEGVLRFGGILSENGTLLEVWKQTADELARAMKGIQNFDLKAAGGAFLGRASDSWALMANPITAIPTWTANAVFALQDAGANAEAVAAQAKAAGDEVDTLASKASKIVIPQYMGPQFGTSGQFVANQKKQNDAQAKAAADARKREEEQAAAERARLYNQEQANLAAIDAYLAEERAKEIRQEVATIRIEELDAQQQGNEQLAIELELKARLIEIENSSLGVAEKRLNAQRAQMDAEQKKISVIEKGAKADQKASAAAKKASEERTSAAVTYADTAIAGLKQITGAKGENVAITALLDSIQMGYQGAAMMVTGNYVGGAVLIGQGLVAQGLSALAGSIGSGGGGSAGGGGSRPSGFGGPGGAQIPEADLRRSARIQAEERANFDRDMRPIQITIDNSNQVLLDSQRGARIVSAAGQSATLETIRR